MRRFLFAFLCFSLASGLMAQRKKPQNLTMFEAKKLHFGFYLGINFMDANVIHSGFVNKDDKVYYTDLKSLEPGFSVGIISSLRLGKSFALRCSPGLSFGQRTFSFQSTEHPIPADPNQVKIQSEEDLRVKSTYIELPLNLRYKALRINNFQPYLFAGGNIRIDLARSKNDPLRFNLIDPTVEFGVGFDTYLEYFRFGTELKISLGLTDILDHERTEMLEANGGVYPDEIKYTRAIDKLTSRIFVIAFNFE